MPQVLLAKTVHINGQTILAWSPGIMVTENDRFTVIDPANNNELIRGMTPEFAAKLVDKGLMLMVEYT